MLAFTVGLLCLCWPGLCTLSVCVPHSYHIVNEPKTWTEAQTHCREYYTDLATVDDVVDMGRLMQSVNGSYNASGWIGLYDDTLNNWRWSLEDDSFYTEGGRDFRQWWEEPDNFGGKELCVVMVFDNKWHDAPCDLTFPVICYDGEVSVTLITANNIIYKYINRHLLTLLFLYVCLRKRKRQ